MPKTLFIDSTPDIDRLWKRVHGAARHPRSRSTWGRSRRPTSPSCCRATTPASTMRPTSREATLGRCNGLKHIVFLGTGAGSFIDLAAAERLGIKVSTIKGYGDTAVAEHAMGLVFAAARHIATMHKIMRDGGWQVMQGMELKGKTLGLIGPRRHRPRDGAPGQGHRAPGDRLQPLGRARMRPCPWWPSTSCSRARTSSACTSRLNDGTRHFLDRARLQQAQAGRHPRQHGAGRRRRRGRADRSAALRATSATTPPMSSRRSRPSPTSRCASSTTSRSQRIPATTRRRRP